MIEKIIDSHIHLWDPNHLTYPWLEEVPDINRPFLPDDFSNSVGDYPVCGQIFVQAACLPEQGLDEVEWVSQLAKTYGGVLAIVAFAPLEIGQDAKQNLEHLSQFPLVKGVRRLIQSEPLGFAIQPEFVAGVKQLAEFDLSFDICIKHHQLGNVLELVKQCPDVNFVLDHIGKPDIAQAIHDPWKQQMSELAAFSNVLCKLSGLVTEADHAQWKPADLKPYIAHVLETFGPQRVMFGSDWPVCRLAASYQRWLELALEATAGLSEAERHQVFYQNAANFYRVDPC